MVTVCVHFTDKDTEPISTAIDTWSVCGISGLGSVAVTLLITFIPSQFSIGVMHASVATHILIYSKDHLGGKVREGGKEGKSRERETHRERGSL